MLDAPDARRRMLDALDAAQTETRNVKGLNAILPGMREMLEGGTFNYTPGGRPWRECRPWVCPGKCPRRGHCPGRARRPGAAGTCPKRRPRSKFGQALARILPVPNFHKNKNPQISKNIKTNQTNVENVQMQKCVFLHFVFEIIKKYPKISKHFFFHLMQQKRDGKKTNRAPGGGRGAGPRTREGPGSPPRRQYLRQIATAFTTNYDGNCYGSRRRFMTTHDNL